MNFAAKRGVFVTVCTLRGRSSSTVCSPTERQFFGLPDFLMSAADVRGIDTRRPHLDHQTCRVKISHKRSMTSRRVPSLVWLEPDPDTPNPGVSSQHGCRNDQINAVHRPRRRCSPSGYAPALGERCDCAAQALAVDGLIGAADDLFRGVGLPLLGRRRVRWFLHGKGWRIPLRYARAALRERANRGGDDSGRVRCAAPTA